MRRNLFALLLIAPMALTLSSCNRDDNDESAFPPTGPSQLSITFLNPLNGDGLALSAGPVTVQVAITGLEMDCTNVGGGNIPGHGHWHLLFDGAYQDLSCTQGTNSAGIQLNQPGAALGNHVLTARLVRNDHSTIDERTDAIIVINAI